VENSDGSWSIVDLRSGSPDGSDKLWNIELLQFSDSLQTLGTELQPLPEPPPPPPPPPPLVLTNAAPAISSANATAVLTEWADKSANETANTPHTAAGSIVYSDAEALDTHSASFAPRGSGYVGTLTLNTGSIDTADTVGWSFSVSDSAIDYLKAGQTKTQLYDVTIADGHGGTVVQTLTITLTGAADATVRGGRKARGNDPDSAPDTAAHDGFAFGSHRGTHDPEEDQMPTPYPTSADHFVSLLGGHFHLGEYPHV
jgi:VCBS repeat-containing protein